jgi:YD repeat-containing protein
MHALIAVTPDSRLASCLQPLDGLTRGDDRDALKAVTRSGDAQGFGWDAAGNRTSHSRAGLNYNLGLDPLSNRLFTISGSTSRSFGYDAVGNLVRDTQPDGTRSFSYDAFNRLETFYLNATLSGTYHSNALNQRVWTRKAAPGTTKRFVYGSAGELLYEDGPTPTSYVWVGGELLGIVLRQPQRPSWPPRGDDECQRRGGLAGQQCGVRPNRGSGQHWRDECGVSGAILRCRIRAVLQLESVL